MQRLASLILIVAMFSAYYGYLSCLGKLDQITGIVGVLYVLYGFINFIFYYRTVSGRSVGITGNANSYGLVANIALSFATYYYIKADRRYKKYWLLFMIILAGESFLSGSRTAFVLLVLWLLFFIFIVLKKRNALVALPFLLLFILRIPDSMLLRIPGLNRLVTMGVDRDELWEYALSIYRQRPWFGWGYATAKTKTSMSVSEGLGFHSSYITMLVEVGKVGLILILILCLITMIRGIRYWRASGSTEMIIFLFVFIQFLICFYSESSMTSVGSTEGFMFWGSLVWIMTKSRETISLNKDARAGDYIELQGEY